MKRTLTLALAAILILSSSLCGAAFASEEAILRTVSCPDPSGYNDRADALFTEQTGIKIVRDTVPYGQEIQKLLTSFMANEGTYDVFIMDVVDVAKWVTAGWVLPVTDKITDAMKADLLPLGEQSVVYQGEWYGLPLTGGFKSMLYNKGVLEKAGFDKPAENWDEFVTQCQAMQEKGGVKYAVGWSWAQGECLTCDFVALASTFGGTFFDENGQPMFNDEGSVEALQFMVDSIYEYGITDPASLTWTESNVQDAMFAGDVGYAMGWGMAKTACDDPTVSKAVGQWNYTLIPSKPGMTHSTVSGLGSVSIAANSKHKDLAWQYVDWYSGLESGGAKREAISGGWAPAWVSLYSDPDIIAAVPDLPQLQAQSEHVINRPQVPYYNEFSAALQQELQSALTQAKSPKQALDDAVAATLQIIKEY